MEEDNHTMNISIMQYLETIKTYIWDNHASKPGEDLDLISSTPNNEHNNTINQIWFEDEQGGNLAFLDHNLEPDPIQSFNKVNTNS